MTDLNIIEKSAKLRYVSIYNKLFKMINEGYFPEDSRLPSEPDLAKDLGVSRTTLRQALYLLQDDGLVKNIRGKGNFIVKTYKSTTVGLEKIGNLMYKCLEKHIDNVEMDFYLEPPSDYFVKVLGRKTAATVSIDRWYKFNNEAIAYTYTIMPIETISTFNLDLNKKDDLLQFIEEYIYTHCTNTSIDIKISSSGKFATKKYSISSDEHYYLIEEGVYSNSEHPIALNKHYLPLSHSSIKIHPKK